MARLSSPIENIKPSYTVVVIGSGYGGAISASRMARAGQSVCVLERGRELVPGEFPESKLATLPELQVDSRFVRLGRQTALFDVRFNEEINVVVGCGLGGTSLINAGVVLRPDLRVFRDAIWPRALADDLDGLSEGFSLAERMLGVSPYPSTWPALPKMQAHESSARAMDKPFLRVPLAVTFEDGSNPVGVAQKACSNCGSCVTGCNHGSKNTVAMNYLPDARNHGAELYTCAQVRYLERRGEEWLVHFHALESGRDVYRDAPTHFVRCKVVILAAGTLGSTEILLRSRERGLPLSGTLGQHFTGNGDLLSFAYECDREINGVGWSGATPPPGPPVGPTITSAIQIRGADDEEDVLIEEGAIPAALGLTTATGLRFVDKIKNVLWPMRRRARMAAARRSPRRSSQTYLVMCVEDERGAMSLIRDRLRVSWPGVGKQRPLYAADKYCQEVAQAIGGTYLRNPLWSKPLGDRLVTVHPLGGCGMSDDAARGVTNDRCQVFAGTSGTAVHDGLHVCDGAVIPRPLGVNPLLTICAIAERACRLLAQDRGWTISHALPGAAAPPAPPIEAVGMQLSERMAGFFLPGVTDSFERGAREGKAAGSSLAFMVTIVAQDLDAMLTSPEHEARMHGTATAPALSPAPLMVTDGTFNLFTVDPAQPGYRFMRYRMRLTTDTGRPYWLDGVKYIGNDAPIHAWRDATTLFTTIHDGPDASAPVLGKGILHIGVGDVLRLLRTIKPLRARGLLARLRANIRFAYFFFASLLAAYLRDSAS